MSRIRINHVTHFTYSGEVTASYNEVRMLPSSTDGQFVIYSNLDISPISSAHTYVDYWGTKVGAFETLRPHSELSLSAASLVDVQNRRSPQSDLNWDEMRATSLDSVMTVEQLVQTAKTEPPQEVVDIARGIATASATPSQAALAICWTLGERVQYVQGATDVGSTAAEAWDAQKGVCQDIAHIAIGAIRSVGIPARYVSGYLHPHAEPTIGETVPGESHAWVEWFSGEWRGFDPTNLVEIGERHVIVGRGRDYADIAPVRGVYAGSSDSALEVTVELTREA